MPAFALFSAVAGKRYAGMSHFHNEAAPRGLQPINKSKLVLTGRRAFHGSGLEYERQSVHFAGENCERAVRLRPTDETNTSSYFCECCLCSYVSKVFSSVASSSSSTCFVFSSLV